LNYQIGSWLAEPDRCLLTNDGDEVHLEPKSMDVLVYLAKRPGQVVSIQEMLRSLWPDTLTGDYAIHNAISILRKSFNDSRISPEYIRTVPKRGYQLIAEVYLAPDSSEDTTSGFDIDLESETNEHRATVLKDDKSDNGIELNGNPSKWESSDLSSYLTKHAKTIALTTIILVFTATTNWLRQSQDDEHNHPTTMDVSTKTQDANLFSPPIDLVGNPAPIRSIAVLPLENLSKDPEQQYFADGMTATIIGDIGKIRSLHVVSRRSVLQYQDTKKSLSEIAQELNVDAVLEGAVLRVGNKVRINVELIDGRTDRQLWSDRFEGELLNVLALQNDIARSVAEQIKAKLSSEERAALSATHIVEPQAFDAYLHAMQLLSSKPTMAIRAWGPEAVRYLEQAVALDEKFAAAWGSLGQVRLSLALLGMAKMDPEELLAAKQAIQKALDLNDQHGGIYVALGRILLHLDWDIDNAREAYSRGLELSPRDPGVLTAYAKFIWEVDGKVDDALNYASLAQQLAPSNLGILRTRIWLLLQMRQYEKALELVEQAKVLNPNFAAQSMVKLYEYLGRNAESQVAQLALWTQCGTPCDSQRNLLGQVITKGGGIQTYRRIMADNLPKRFFEVTSPWIIASVYEGVGEKDSAINWLKQGVSDRDPILITGLGVFPDYDLLRFDSRFQDLINQAMGGQIFDEDPRVLAGIAQKHIRSGQTAVAIGHLEAAIERYPEDPSIPRWSYFLSLAHFVAGRHDVSLDWAERSLKQNGDVYNSAFSHFLRASNLAQLDRIDAARDAVNEGVSLWPGHLDIRRDLRSIFTIREPELQDRYLSGLLKAGLNDQD
jgi:TolB-like protein/DNA-binding winged helix-turn-helix (wHTH) protein/Flp pilus assembly protein TadD